MLFDVEDPSELAPLAHDVIICPWWTQKPLLHSVSAGAEVEEQRAHVLQREQPLLPLDHDAPRRLARARAKRHQHLGLG